MNTVIALSKPGLTYRYTYVVNIALYADDIKEAITAQTLIMLVNIEWIRVGELYTKQSVSIFYRC